MLDNERPKPPSSISDWKEPAGASRTANKNAWAKDWDDDADDNFLQDLRAELAK